MINLEDVRNHEEVLIVSFYDGYIDGHKYDITVVNTTYTGFNATYGALYFENTKEGQEEANKIAQRLNKEQLDSVEER